jgi:hypothetical protein
MTDLLSPLAADADARLAYFDNAKKGAAGFESQYVISEYQPLALLSRRAVTGQADRSSFR